MQAEEIDRIELQLGTAAGTYAGYLRSGDALRPLPIGSHLDAATGAFTWQPGVGFVGAYDLVFVRWAGGRPVARQDVRIVLNPKAATTSGRRSSSTRRPPSSRSASRSCRRMGGGPRSGRRLGCRGVHVWAYPAAAAATRCSSARRHTGGERPDVAAFYGGRFRDSSYGLMVDSLASGTYDLAVFAWSTARRLVSGEAGPRRGHVASADAAKNPI